jgi:ArsR family metal-binding transcriptional regulator
MEHQPPIPEIEIVEIMPCLADPEKIRFIARVDHDISSIFPYLNAIMKGAIYNHEGHTLTLKKEGRLISLHPYKIAAGKIIDQKDALEVIEWLKEKMNYCHENRNSIEPSFERRQKLAALDIFRLLPRTNCKRCEELTCLAFAVKLSAEETDIMKCQEIFAAQFAEKKKELLSLLSASGYVVPSVFVSKEITKKEI